MSMELIADALLATLLIAAMAAIWRLDARLSVLRSGQGMLAKTAQDLNVAVARAEAAIQGLRLTANGCGDDLDARIKRARGLADELALLSERATKPSHDLRMTAAAPPQPLLRALNGAR